MFRKVYVEDKDNPPEDPAVEFRLSYTGPLLSTQRDAQGGQVYKVNQRQNRHEIRRVFHRQLADLWQVTPFLRTGERSGPDLVLLSKLPHDYRKETVAARYNMYGFNFVPLVTPELDLLCGLEILFLRPDRPGDVVWRGDIDNRLKTLIDALKVPEPNEEYSSRTPADDEQPMFCLLSDDKLITKLTVETDQLLAPTSADSVSLMITVRIKPYETHIGNMQFA